MVDDTIKLLEECSSGCKMGINSINQVFPFLKDPEMKQILEEYKKRHEDIEKRAGQLLAQENRPEKEPGVVASAMSWFTTEIKVRMEDTSHQVAKLMMDGCNMGIQSISEAKNKYEEAHMDAQKLADDLVDMEEKYVQELEKFI